MYLSEIAIVDVTLIGPLGVLERIKIKSKTYIDFLQKKSCLGIRNNALHSSARPS